jgi:hypothetical protein
MPALAERFTPSMIAHNRQALLGVKTRQVNLSGRVQASRVLLKSLPLTQGGILHKGGNRFLRKQDQDYQTLVRWLEAEKATAQQQTETPGILSLGEMDGLVFVRRPRATPERALEDLDFLPGGDLFWKRGKKEINLTATLHPDGPADIRAPDVRPDGLRVVFAMRQSKSQPFNLWELDLKSRKARPLTFSPSPTIHFLDPLYIPDPEDPEGKDLSKNHLAFVSNRGGGDCLVSPDWILGEVEKGRGKSRLYDQQRTEVRGSLVGRRLRFLTGTHAGLEREVVKNYPGYLTLSPPLPSPADSTSHYQIEAEARWSPCFSAYRLPLAPPGQERVRFLNDLHRLTYTPGQVRRPTRRSTGEILFTCVRSGWQGEKPYFNGALFRTHLDGSNFHTHNGNRSRIPLHHDSRELVSGLEVRIGRTSDSYWGGILLLSEHQFGPSIETFNPLDSLDHPYLGIDHFVYNTEHPFQWEKNVSGLPRFTPGWISLDPQARLRGATRLAYRDPAPLPDGGFLVARARSRKPFALEDPLAAPNFDIVKISPAPNYQAHFGFLRDARNRTPWKTADHLNEYGFRRGKLRHEVVVSGPEAELWPRPVWRRLKAPVKLSLVSRPDLPGKAPGSHGVPSYPPGTPADLHVLDLGLLETFFEGATPMGTRRIRDIAGVRVIGHELPSSDSQGRSFIITEQALEGDSSFLVRIPSGIPFDLQSLDARGYGLHKVHRWLYCQPGERHTLSIPRKLFPQTCGGCHGGLDGSPLGVVGPLDGVTSASRTQASFHPKTGVRRIPSNSWPSGKIPGTLVSFEASIRPLLRGRCLSCHVPGESSPTLSGPQARSHLLPFLGGHPFLARKSPLLELLTEGSHPYHLMDQERRTLARWIDMGASP